VTPRASTINATVLALREASMTMKRKVAGLRKHRNASA
jgi:hypothetical protein